MSDRKTRFNLLNRPFDPNRRVFIKGSAALFFLSQVPILLSGCGGTGSAQITNPGSRAIPVGNERPITGQEWADYLEKTGMATRMESHLNEYIATDSNLSMDAREIIAGYVAAKGASSILSKATDVVATPDFLLKNGLTVSQDLHIFRTRIVNNGGLAFYDPNTRTYVKMIPTDMENQAKYLRQSADTWRTAWNEAGIGPEKVNQIKYFEATYQGRSYAALSTPDVGLTLESRMTHAAGPTIPALLPNKVKEMLEEYYLRVLHPMNKAGGLQRDINFKNLCVYEESGKPAKLVPIDLDATPYVVESSILPQWQYQQLVDRAAKRGVILDSFDQFVLRHQGELADVTTVIKDMKMLDLKIDGSPLKVIISMDHIEGLKGEQMWQLVSNVRTALAEKFRSTPQGGIFRVEVPTGQGNGIILDIVKTVGAEPETYNSTLVRMLSGARQLAKFGDKALLLLAVWDFVSQIGDIDYQAQLISTVSTPIQMGQTRRTELVGDLEQIFEALLTKKDLVAAEVLTHPELPNYDEITRFVGLTRQQVDYMRERYNLFKYPDPALGEVIKDKVRNSPLPVAQIQANFQPPLPGLIDGDKMPVDGYLSPITQSVNGSQQDMLIVWVKEKNAPVAIVWSDDGKNNWQIVSLVGGADLKMTLDSTIPPMVMSCTLNQGAVSEGRLDMYCEENK